MTRGFECVRGDVPESSWRPCSDHQVSARQRVTNQGKVKAGGIRFIEVRVVFAGCAILDIGGQWLLRPVAGNLRRPSASKISAQPPMEFERTILCRPAYFPARCRKVGWRFEAGRTDLACFEYHERQRRSFIGRRRKIAYGGRDTWSGRESVVRYGRSMCHPSIERAESCKPNYKPSVRPSLSFGPWFW